VSSVCDEFDPIARDKQKAVKPWKLLYDLLFIYLPYTSEIDWSLWAREGYMLFRGIIFDEGILALPLFCKYRKKVIFVLELSRINLQRVFCTLCTILANRACALDKNQSKSRIFLREY
jgi:hypothetical protein